MKFNVHAGHNPKGKIACGASDLLDESTENRNITKQVIKLLKKKGHTAYNCTVNNGTNQMDVLKKIVAKCNAHKVDLDISIHFNAGRNDKKGDKKVAGTEVCIKSLTGVRKAVGDYVCNKMKKIGFTDRGTNVRENLYFLNHTSAPAVLIEVCFVDDMDDYRLYKNLGCKKVAAAIVDGILAGLKA